MRDGPNIVSDQLMPRTQGMTAFGALRSLRRDWFLANGLSDSSLTRLHGSQRFSNPEHGRVVRLRRNAEAKLSAHLQHRLVLVQQQPDQVNCAGLLCALDQSSHKQSPNATPMPVATHCNGKLCAPPIWIGGVARDA